MTTVRKRRAGLSSWDDRVYVKAYTLARTGLSDNKVAELVGVSYPTFRKWVREKPALAEALAEARASTKPAEGEIRTAGDFIEYSYGLLPEELQGLWDQIAGKFDTRTATTLPSVEWLDDLFSTSGGKKARQKIFIHALVSCNFNASEACKRVGIAKSTFDNWMLDPNFQHLIEQMEWHKNNLFEAGLIGLVRQGDSAATIFANRARNRDRGYDVKHEMEVRHEVEVNFADLNLPPEVLRVVLHAIRERNEQQASQALPPRQGQIVEVVNDRSTSPGV